jgi:hypothetical protein
MKCRNADQQTSPLCESDGSGSKFGSARILAWKAGQGAYFYVSFPD